jgi:lysophospholipase L1-like esterase
MEWWPVRSRGVAVAAFAVLVALCGVVVLVPRDSVAARIGAIVGITIAAGVFLVALRRWHARHPDASSRVWVPLAVGALGLLVLLVWSFVRTDGVGVAGFAILYTGIGAAVGELRVWPGNRIGGIATLGCAALLVGGGIAGLRLWAVGGAAYALVAGLLVAPVGLNLLSGAMLRESGSSTRLHPMLLWAGAAVTVLATVVLGLSSHSARYAIVLLAGCIVLATVIASPSAADVALFVGAVGLVFMSVQPGDPVPAALHPASGQRAFAALGDSYMSGEGSDTFYRGTNDASANHCRRAAAAYPVRLVGGTGGPAAFFLACSGATIDQVLADDQYADEPMYDAPHAHGQLRKLRVLASRNDLTFILVSVGGNDAKFGDIGRICLLPGDCSELGAAWIAHLSEVQDRLTAAYREIQDAFPTVPIVAVPYPVPIGDGAYCSKSLFSADERRFLHGFTVDLDRTVALAARDARISYVDTVQAAFDGHRICDADPTMVNFLVANSVTGPIEDRVNPANWLHDDLHPTPVGNDRFAHVVADWLTEHPPSVPGRPVLAEARRSIDAIMGRRMGRECAHRDELPRLHECTNAWSLRRSASFGLLYGTVAAALFLAVWLVAVWLVAAKRAAA